MLEYVIVRFRQKDGLSGRTEFRVGVQVSRVNVQVWISVFNFSTATILTLHCDSSPVRRVTLRRRDLSSVSPRPTEVVEACH